MARKASSTDDLFTPAPLPVAALDDAQRLACLRLIRSENVGPVTFRELVNHFGGATRAIEALPELARRSGRKRPIAICPRDRAEAELSAAARIGASPLFTIEPGYPYALAALAMPPPLVYVKGRLDLLQRDGFAMVGARNASAAGVALAGQLATAVGVAGFVIVSGLARGIDAAAHTAALTTGTVAVLAGGIDFVYPPENAALQAAIGETGCLITEQAPGFRPRGADFPRRNRIISGLSLAVLVVEAARRSGSLITAHAAAEQGREVMAIPGHPLDPRAEGPNALLKKPGVTLITSAEDILSVLEPMRQNGAGPRQREALREAGHPRFDHAAAGQAPPAAISPPPSPPTMIPGDAVAAVQAVLGPQPATLDQIVRATGLTMPMARGALLELSLAGRLDEHGAGLVSLRPPEA